MPNNRGTRQDDKKPEEYKGNGAGDKSLIDRIADYITGDGLLGKARRAIEEAERKRKEV